MSYFMKLLQAAKSKLTVYAAGLTTLVAMIPQLITDYWGQMEAAIPHLTTYHKTVVAIGLLVTIWARVRREITLAQVVPAPQPGAVVKP